MAKLCPKCNTAVMVGTTCRKCGAELKDVPYRELVKIKPLWAITPFLAIPVLAIIISIIVFKPPFFYSVEGCVIMVVVLVVVVGILAYVNSRAKSKSVEKTDEYSGWFSSRED